MDECKNEESQKSNQTSTTSTSRFSLPKRLLEQSRLWIPTAIGYGTALTLAILYFTEFKAILKYVPYYNLGYATESESESMPKHPNSQIRKEEESAPIIKGNQNGNEDLNDKKTNPNQNDNGCKTNEDNTNNSK